MSPREELLTVAETAAEMRTSPKTIYRRVRRFELEAVRDGRRVLIPRSAVERWRHNHTYVEVR